MTKSDAIREVISKNWNYTNEEIKFEVKRRYGLTVETNHICNCIGAQKKRIGAGCYAEGLIEAAKSLIRNSGGFKQAKNILYIAESKMP